MRWRIMTKPWEETNAWKTPAQFYAWVRGQLRRGWSDYPLRTEFKNESCRPVTKEEKDAKKFHTSTKTVGQCVFCKDWFPKSKLEVDHKTPSGGCTSHEEAEQFLWYCMGASKEDFQLSCKPCHKIKTYAERYGFTFGEAVMEKQVVEFGKLTAKEQSNKLHQFGLSTTGLNADKRKNIYRNYLKGES